MNIFGIFGAGRKLISRLLITLSISGIMLWFQLYSYSAVMNFVQENFFGTANLDALGGTQVFDALGMLGGMNLQNTDMTALVGSGAIGTWLTPLGISGELLEGLSGFWLQWGLWISVAGIVIGILLSDAPFRTIGTIGLIVAGLVIALPFVIRFIFSWAESSQVAPEIFDKLAPALIFANEQLQNYSLPIVVISLIVAVVAYGLHFLLKKKAAPAGTPAGATV